MKRIFAYISVLMICFVCGAKDIVIMPQYAVGDTLKYRANYKMTMFAGNDSIIMTSKYLPQVVVADKNDTGFVLEVTTSLDKLDVACSKPELIENMQDKGPEMQAVAEVAKLRIQLGADCRPDTILNFDAVKQDLLK